MIWYLRLGFAKSKGSISFFKMFLRRRRMFLWAVENVRWVGSNVLPLGKVQFLILRAVLW